MFIIPKKAMFVYAHMDDETILSYGTIAKLVDFGCSVKLMCVCGNGRKNDDGLQKKRELAFLNIVENLGIDVVRFDYNDLTLTDEVRPKIEYEIHDFSPDTVFTHSKDEQHFEHCFIGNTVLVACRSTSKSTVLRLFSTSSQTRLWKYESFSPNVFINISKYADEKKSALKLYGEELGNDLRSAEATMTWNKMWGLVSNSEYSEPYNLVFDRSL